MEYVKTVLEMVLNLNYFRFKNKYEQNTSLMMEFFL